MEKILLCSSQVCIDTAGEANGLGALYGGGGGVIYKRYTRLLVDLNVSFLTFQGQYKKL